MPEAGRLHEAFVDELRDACDAGKQLVQALPKVHDAATAPLLREAVARRLTETEARVAQVEGLLAGLGVPDRRKRCDGIAGILAEAVTVIDENFDDAALEVTMRNIPLRKFGDAVDIAEASSKTPDHEGRVGSSTRV